MRDYGYNSQIGLEKTPQEFVANLVEVFDLCKKVLRNDGTLWINIGDSYSQKNGVDYKKGDLLGVPWMLAFAMRQSGWFLRSDVIWAKCLSGPTYLYAKTIKGEMPIQVREIEKIIHSGVELWTGSKWSKVVGFRRSLAKELYKIVLRNGEIIKCTANHKWPLVNGDIAETSELKIGSEIKVSQLPESNVYPSGLDDAEIGWLVGMYLAEGSKGKNNRVLQFAGNINETARFDKLKIIAEKFHGTCKRYITSENGITDNIYGKILIGIIDTYIGGKNVKNKRLKNKCWQRSNKFLESLLQGYLEGDGHFDAANDRWRLGFAYNIYLARDIRILVARLGLRVKLSSAYSKNTSTGKKHRIFRGEIRFAQKDHFNKKSPSEIVSISKIRGGSVFDISISDEPHLFCLASGVLSHNSNPIPSGVSDRPISSHEYLFLMSKSEDYYYDAEAIKENAVEKNKDGTYKKRHKRDVWTVPVASFKGAHFAVFPTALIEPCVKSSTSEHGCCAECKASYVRQIQKNRYATRPAKNNKIDDTGFANRDGGRHLTETSTIGWKKACNCSTNDLSRCTILDPFCGSGTTGVVCLQHNQNFIGIDGKNEYLQLAENRLSAYKNSINFI